MTKQKQVDIFESTIEPRKIEKKVKRFFSDLNIPSNTVLFCHQCNYVPRLCKCIVTEEEAIKLNTEINSFFINRS